MCRCVCDNIHNKGVLHTLLFSKENRIFCNEVLVSHKLLMHAEFSQFHLISLIDNHFQLMAISCDTWV